MKGNFGLMESLFKAFFDETVLAILCIGDLMLDVFVEGSVERISPEAPIPVFKYKSEKEVLGGAGNVVRNLAALELRSRLVALVGQDYISQKIDKLLEEIPLIAPHLVKTPLIKTTQKTRFTAGFQQLLRVDRETPQSVAQEHTQEVMVAVKEAACGISTIIISDYGKGVVSKGLLGPIIQNARQKNQFVIVDPKGKDYGCYAGANLITPNRDELSQATNRATDTDEDCIEAATCIIKNHDVEAVLVTRGSRGMTLVQKNREPVHVHARALEVFDVSGAGDTVVAVMAAGVNAGLSLDKILGIANHAGGIVVGKVGTAPIEKKEILAYCTSEDRTEFYASKVLSVAQLCDKRVRWQRRGLKVGFTNGCFDLLHSGHIKLLREAHERCDRLIVGLNSDASVKRLKGDSRPLQSEQDRALILSALEFVHGIVIFDEDTPLATIKALKPDLLVKGADYALEEIVGAEEVLSAGGKVHRVILVPEKSTTRLAHHFDVPTQVR